MAGEAITILWLLTSACTPERLEVEWVPPHAVLYTGISQCGAISCTEKWMTFEGKRIELGSFLLGNREPYKRCDPVTGGPGEVREGP